MSVIQQQKQARRRLKQLGKALSASQTGWSDSEEDDLDHEANVTMVRIGDVSIDITPPANPELVPEVQGPFYEGSQEMLRHLRWIMQKDKLGQDIFLIGPPGPLRRSLVMKYAEMTQREIEYVALSKDVTDADLKQRRELYNGTSYYVDQASVRAAIHGRILVLDGIEKAERNVLPILNNLLENREMSLDDGRFLTTKEEAGATDASSSKFEKVDKRFLVFALGLPVPPYVGYPLDPPLRSRFQSRDVRAPSFRTQMEQMMTLTHSKASRHLTELLVSLSMVLGVQPNQSASREIEVPEFPMTIETLAPLMENFPDIHPRFLVDLLYPYPLLPTCDREQLSVINAAYRQIGIRVPSDETPDANTQTFSGYNIANLEPFQPLVSIDQSQHVYRAIATFSHDTKPAVAMTVYCGPKPFSPAEFFVETPYHRAIFSSMLLVHAGGRDMCLVGTHKGVGKSALVRHFARNLGYTMDYIPLYRDMSSRDLLQRRSTTASGDTVWENSLLVEAAIHGHLAILDGIEALSYGTLNTLQRLLCDREAQLPDGTHLINPSRYEKLMKKSKFTIDELDAKRLIPIHPSFRVIALARAGTSGQTDGKSGAWLTAEILSMFHFIVVDSLPSVEEQDVLKILSPQVNDDKLNTLLTFARRLRHDTDDTVRMLSSALSTRQLIRICRHLAYFQDDSLYKIIHKTALSKLMPLTVRQALHNLLVANGITPPDDAAEIEELKIEILPSRERPEHVRIGNVIESVFQGGDPMLIPNVVFHENPAHTEILREMLKDYQLGDHLLLIGNQGVGKNKLADYFLQILQLPREYIQLHRDSTVQNLTTTPAIRDGILVYEDSALVKAVQNGTILVVDEADKAPTYVTAVLKSLVEDGQMILGDGRRIVSKEADIQEGDRYILVHPNFRMIVLANRPGYPFLGNDFYREIGDVFSCHAVDNPDKASEMYLLLKYGPDVPVELLDKLTNAFTDLRKLVDEGLISYPYSTRELVNIVLHLQNYPGEGISKILQNVFDFDQYDKASKDMLIEIFEKHGIPIELDSGFSMNLGDIVQLDAPVPTMQWSRLAKPLTREAVLEISDITIRGDWNLGVGKNVKTLEWKEGRTATFSEQLYNFALPTRGEGLDIVALDDGSLLALTTNPIVLHRIDANHHKVDNIDLYDYFPLTGSPPRMRIALVRMNGTIKYAAVHNPVNNELLCCDLAKNTALAVVLRGLAPYNSIMCNQLQDNGVLVFYQEDQPIVVVIDFNESRQFTVTLPFPIKKLHVIETGFWFAHSSQDGLIYAIYPKQGAAAPSLVEPLEVLGLNGQLIDHPVKILLQEFAPGFKFAQNEHPRKFASIVEGCSMREFLQGSGRLVHSSFLNPAEADTDPVRHTRGTSLYLKHSNQLAVVYPSKDSRSETKLDILNMDQNQLWRIKLPIADINMVESEYTASIFNRFQVKRDVVYMCELFNGQLVTMDTVGIVRVWQVDPRDLYQAMQTWKHMVGVDQKALSIIYETDNGTYATSVPGTADGSQTPGNTDSSGSLGDGAQGDGTQGPKCQGGDGVGQGGKSGQGSGGTGGDGGSGGSPSNSNVNTEGRKEATFEAINNLKMRTSENKPAEVTEAQREIHDHAMDNMLKKIEMTREDYEMFQKYMENIGREIRELRVILEGAEAKKRERVWLKNQASGDLDDTKIVEGLTGERAIYRKRGDDDPELGLFQDKPKRMNFVFDLSASMFRFNTHDRRLERSMEVALMLMESFRGFEHKFAYRIAGHSGDGANIEFVVPGKYPKTEKDELEIIKKMRMHSQYCLSGDNTLGAASHSIKEIVKEEADDYFVVILSDANLVQYAIRPTDIARTLKSDDRVTAQMIFIGSLQDQAEQLKSVLGSQAHICTENKDLPKIIKSLFLTSMMKA